MLSAAVESGTLIRAKIMQPRYLVLGVVVFGQPMSGEFCHKYALASSNNVKK